MLYLPPPFGLGQKCHHLSLRAPNARWEEVIDIAQGFGCPSFIAAKVGQCILHSGRYDCLTTPAVSVPNLGQQLRAIGGSLVYTPMDWTPGYWFDAFRHNSQTAEYEAQHSYAELVRRTTIVDLFNAQDQHLEFIFGVEGSRALRVREIYHDEAAELLHDKG